MTRPAGGKPRYRLRISPSGLLWACDKWTGIGHGWERGPASRSSAEAIRRAPR